MKKWIVLGMLMVSGVVYGSTFVVKSPSANVTMKFEGQIVSAPTVNITSPYFPSMTLTKAQLQDLRNGLDILTGPIDYTKVNITITLDQTATPIPPVIVPNGTGGVGIKSVAPKGKK